MNIKEAIDKGLYPKDEKGRALVPTQDGRKVCIYASDNGPELPLLGSFVQSWSDNEHDGYVCRFDDDGRNARVDGHVRLLPPPPRKVKVTAWAMVAPSGDIRHLVRDPGSFPPRTDTNGEDDIVELTGERLEPWS